MRKIVSVFVMMAIFIGASQFTATAQQRGDWVKLGMKKVDYKLDRDVIPVGIKEGSFNKLRVRVTGAPLNMHKMVVKYGNGSSEELALRHNFAKGSATRVIDLKGGNRIITQIVFWYDSKNAANRRATVHVWGKQ